MKRYYFVLFLTLLCFTVHAQKSKNNGSEEEFKAWKKARVGKDPQTTEVQYEDILNGFIDAEEQNCRLDKEYLKKYQSVLSNRKIYMVLRAEIKFNRNMLKIIQTSPKK